MNVKTWKKVLTAITTAVVLGVSGVLGGIIGAAIGSGSVSAFADESSLYDVDYCYEEGYNICADLESEGSVLLKNNNCLPLAEGSKVTLLGSMSYNYVEGGTGSGAGQDDSYTVMMNDAFNDAGMDVNPTAWTWLKRACGKSRGTASTIGNITKTDWTTCTTINEFPAGTYQSARDDLVVSGYTEYAIVTFARTGAEDGSPSMDYDGNGDTLTGTTYLELDENEKSLLAFCKDNFNHTIVLINSATPMELGFIDDTSYNIDACLWIGLPGEAGLVGVGKVLTGKSNPSGAVVDTYSYDMTTNPTYYNTDDNKYSNANNQAYYEYEEGIYVGYRYYETADAEGYFDSASFTSHEFKNGKASGYDQVVQFPFGFGLSYTTFTQQITESDIDLSNGGTSSITVEVTNTGKVAGKDIVQLYMEAPYNQDSSLGIKGVGLEKAKVVLIGYAKTDEIAAGGSDTVTIEFNTDDLASYDNFGQGCYVLEKGTYYFNIQDNAHCWSHDQDASNAAYDYVSAELSTTIVYNEEGVGPRDSDAVVAENALDDVTAGDGNMLDGYLSRSNFVTGMAHIMTHVSNDIESERLAATDGIASAIAVSGTDSYTYTYETYNGGEKVTKTSTIYAKGANMMPFSAYTPDGIDTSTLSNPDWDKTYYVLEDGNGDAIINEDGYFEVLDEAPADGSAYHKLCVDDMAAIPMDTEEGNEIWEKLASETSINEAVNIQGSSGFAVPAVSSVGKKYQSAHDGPAEVGAGSNQKATWFPCSVTIASTWSDELAYEQGLAYGHQCVLFGVGGAYSPSMNIHRSPFGGRNFEYYSEDGVLSGNISGNVVSAIMSTGTSVYIKHFALNEGDTNRNGALTWVDEQAVREIYLLSFEICCKKYGADGIMGSLNRIGMSWFHYGLYITILRNEWNFKGYLITDADGADGDVYNTPQAMMCVDGSMLAIGCFSNATATVTAYGDATQYAYAQNCLHNIMKYALYQYGHGVPGVSSEAVSVNVVGITIGVLVAVVVVAAVICVLAGRNYYRKLKNGEYEEEEDDE